MGATLWLIGREMVARECPLASVPCATRKLRSMHPDAGWITGESRVPRPPHQPWRGVGAYCS